MIVKIHKSDCPWVLATCEYKETHHYCPHPEHACTCPAEPTTEQKQRYALRQCYLLALRMARKEQKRDDSRSSEWNHVIRFCKDADEAGNIVGSSILRQSDEPAD